MFIPQKWLYLILKVALVLLGSFLLLRIEFLFWNRQQFNGMDFFSILKAFLWGVRFDLGATAAVLAPLILASAFWPRTSRGRRRAGWVFFLYLFIVQGPLWFACAADLELVNFVGRRSTWDSLFLISEAQGKWLELVSTYWKILLIGLAQMILFLKVMYNLLVANPREEAPDTGIQDSKFKFYASQGFIFFGAILLAVVAIRGGVQKKPMNLGSAQIFQEPVLNALASNTAFAVIKTMGAVKIDVPKYFHSETELLSHLPGGLVAAGSGIVQDVLPAKTNVVVIILESFALEYMGEINGDEGFTPFLDELAKKSLFFRNSFANSRRSIEGIPAILASVPALMNEPFLTSSYVSNRIVGMGNIFAQQGYYTAFFHGGMNGTMYFDTFTARIGFENYFGANEYPRREDHDGTWGIYDEPFLQYAAEKISEQKRIEPDRPIAVSIFTLSSHHPYKIPEKYRNQFPKGPLPILESIAYADLALKKFFNKIQREPWYPNTLFIVTADHAVQHFRKSYENELGDYRIPILFFHPKVKWSSKISTSQVAQQIDILPSCMDLLGFWDRYPKNHLARSLVREYKGDQSITLFLEGKYMQVGSLYYLKWIPEMGTPILLNYDQTPVEITGTDSLGGPAILKNLWTRLKATQQYFNGGMVENSLFR